MIGYLLVCVWAACFTKSVVCDNQVLLELLSYENKHGFKNNKTCCDDTLLCSTNPCDTKISGCLSSEYTDVCNIGTFKTKQHVDQNNIQFLSNLGNNLKNPLNFTFKHRWNNFFILQLSADDVDSFDEKYEVIDNFNKTFHIKAAPNESVSKSTFYYIDGSVSKINFRLSVFCSSNFYGEDCSVYCKPIQFKFKCNESGQKLCEKYWFTNTCDRYCKPRNDSIGRYSCSKSGEKVCFSNWYGTNCNILCRSTVAYACDSVGNRKCLKNWYGNLCNLFCDANSMDHYTCELNTGKKMCHKSWYGKDCAVFCNETLSHTCDTKTGHRMCRENYFGRLCDQFCIAKREDKFVCDRLGQKVCFKHYYGENCAIYVPSLPNKEAVCSVSGQSFVKSFDDRYFMFPDKCTYQLAADCVDDTFAVHMHSKQVSNQSQHVVLYLGSLDIHLNDDNIFVKNQSVSLPYSNNNIFIGKIASYVVISGWNGLKVQWDGKSFYLALSPLYANKTCGLCGNFNGNPQDDLADALGKVTKTSDNFLKSWKRVQLGETCSHGNKGVHLYNPFGYTFRNTTSTLCDKVLFSADFNVCAKHVNPDPYFKKCLEDLTGCKHAQNCVCNSFTEYSRECARKGQVLSWRNELLCPVSCVNGTKHTECGSTCTKTCQNFRQKQLCSQQCIDGCFCPPGTVMENNRCISPTQCSCTHNKKIYQSGIEIKKGCNKCTCENGQWNCTNKLCPGKCMVFGDPHFVTFDGRWFDYNGVCKYLLTKDRVANSFSVVIENSKCSAGDAVSCAKAVTVFVHTQNIFLGHHGRIMVDSTPVNLPYKGAGFAVRRVSSIFITFTSDVGLNVLYDGKTRVYVTVSAHLRNKTYGLCGTFNGNQQDDFMTLQGVPDTNPSSFGNSWKLEPNCHNTYMSRHPCDIETQKAGVAEKKCSKLRLAPFSACHNAVDPEPFIAACRYDVCGCVNGVECLCSAVAAYTKECADEGVVVEWRNEKLLPECSVSCASGLVYQECANMCTTSCLNIADKCEDQCVAGCNCPRGSALNDLDVCVPIVNCPCFDDGQIYPSGSMILRENCEKCTCNAGKFSCAKEKSCQEKQCPPTQVWSTLGDTCLRSCENAHLPCLVHTPVAGCYCPNNTVWDATLSRCIKEERCPCYQNGRMHKDGSTFLWDCNTCSCTPSSTCRARNWHCTSNVCPGTCSVYGDSHYTTFDGKRYMFEGQCDYIIAHDACANNGGTFSLLAKNIACGASGATCTKSLTLVLNDTMLHLQRHHQIRVTPSPGYFSTSTEYEIIKTTFYHIIHSSKMGVILMWDGGTRIVLTLDPKFKGSTCGLCGNFNDNQNDDFTTPEYDVVVNTETFGDSWKIHAVCPDTKQSVHPCVKHRGRASWSHKQCNVINRDVFKACHEVVNPRPYFEACFYDACSCDMGGDCECLCTAVAAYAQACSLQGVHVMWRSQELCPIQCEMCQEYKACGPANLRTCKNLCNATPQTLPLTCIEGCFCANDTIYHDGKCIKEDECPCYLNGLEYKPRTFVIEDCQQCTCEKGCFECVGQTCSSTSLPITTSATAVKSTTSTVQSTLSTTKSTPSTTSTVTVTTTSTQESTSTPTQSTKEPVTNTTSTILSTASPKTTLNQTDTSTKPPQTSAITSSHTTKELSTDSTATSKSTTKPTMLTATAAKRNATTEHTKPSTTVTVQTTTVKPTLPKSCELDNNTIGFQCQNAKKFCIQKENICDLLFHCPEHDDELNCTSITTSSPKTLFPWTVRPQTTSTVKPCHGYLCRGSSFCIKPGFYCDGEEDCDLGDDENNSDCGTTTTTIIIKTTTATTEIPVTKSTSRKPSTVITSPVTDASTRGFSTAATTTGSVCKLSPSKYACSRDCINSTQVCDGVEDCVDGSDETNCPTSCLPCSTLNFKCHKTCQCTSIYFVCDGNAECTDGSDEIGCPTVNTTTTSVPTTAVTTVRPCANNLVYKQCQWNCQQVCGYLSRRCYEGSRECQPGCGCENGLVNNGTHCVLSSSCSCYDSATSAFYRAGQSWEQGCSVCSCFNNNIKCTRKPCPNLYCPPPRTLISGGCCSKCISGTLPPSTTPSTTPFTCASDEFMCSDQVCISNEWLCDGERDCYGAEDEKGCRTKDLTCVQPIGVAITSIVKDDQFSSSSSGGSPYRPSYGRLNLPSRYRTIAGAWCAQYEANPPHWIQVDLRQDYIIRKVAIQGRHMVMQFVQLFKMKFSLNGYSWETYSYHGNPRVFEGNNAPGAIGYRKLERSIQTRFVRLIVVRYHNKPCLRFELYGCLNATVPTTTSITTVTTSCPEFSCRDGNCIVNTWVCDGKNDCADGWDEMGCDRRCTKDEFRCASGHCISRSYWCDGDKDCYDGSDERNCTAKVCPKSKYACPKGQCILMRHVCDGDEDCVTGADEKNCPLTTTRAATTTVATTTCAGYLCTLSNKCVPPSYLCDHYKDCIQGEDESCCADDVLLCPTELGGRLGKCISRRMLCDGFQDCDDGFDERNCSTATFKPPTTKTPLTASITVTTQVTKTDSGRITSSPTTKACPLNSTCVCENTCESLSQNPLGCEYVNCFDDCSCPRGYLLNNVTGYCYQPIKCPCILEGKIFGIGVTISLKNCSSCRCTLEGFTCVSSCPIPSCPTGYELQHPTNECCKCVKRTVCRADQILTACACPVTCEHQNNNSCDQSNCSEGCVCPRGQYDDGEKCVQLSQCYCVDENKSKHKANRHWKAGKCDTCKCVDSRVTCGKYCPHISCPNGFEISVPRNACCECTPISPVTSSLPPTTVTTSACRQHNQQVMYKDEEQCKGVVTRSSCRGGCESAVISDFLRGLLLRDCSCCRPIATYNTTAQLICIDGRRKDFVYQRFDLCNCQACDSSPFVDMPLG